MTIDFLIEMAWKSAVCAGATLLLLRLVRNRSAAEQSLIAHAGLLCLLLLPFAVAGLPEIELAPPAEFGAAIAEFTPAAAAAVPLEAQQPSGGIDWRSVAMAVYALPALGLLLLSLLALARLQMLRSRAEVLVDPLWLTALAAAQSRLGFKHGTALLVSRELNSPISWGVVRPIIIIDTAAAADTARAEAIIAHELAHVAGLDWLKLLVGRVVVALFWFNPLAWVLARRSHHLCEEAADDAVLRSDIPGVDYAALLVGAARHANGRALIAANGVAPSRHSLTQRVAHVLDPLRPRSPASLRWAAAPLLAAAALNGALAAAEPIVRLPLVTDAFAGARAAQELRLIPNPHASALARAIANADWAARKPSGNTVFHEPRAVRPLITALRDQRPAVRRIALWGLSEMRPAVAAEAAAPVSRLLTDPAPEVRAQAARALGDFGAAGEADGIARLLADPHPVVRREAAHALGDLQSPATRGALMRALKDPDPAVRTKAAWALRQVDEADTILRRYGG
jgi:HEAT repeat protein